MQNFGLLSAFLSAGIANKLIIGLLLVISIYSWGLIISKYQVLRLYLKELNAFDSVVNTHDVKRLNSYFLANNTEYSTLIKLAFDMDFSDRTKREEVKYQLGLLLRNSNKAVDSNIDHLATISNAAPFIGLFGTVIGVINSFNQIGLNASVSLAVIGPGLAEALYATALGLFVAVPASIFYNLINGKIAEYDSKKDYALDKLILLLFQHNN